MNCLLIPLCKILVWPILSGVGGWWCVLLAGAVTSSPSLCQCYVELPPVTLISATTIPPLPIIVIVYNGTMSHHRRASHTGIKGFIRKWIKWNYLKRITHYFGDPWKSVLTGGGGRPGQLSWKTSLSHPLPLSSGQWSLLLKNVGRTKDWETPLILATLKYLHQLLSNL